MYAEGERRKKGKEEEKPELVDVWGGRPLLRLRSFKFSLQLVLTSNQNNLESSFSPFHLPSKLIHLLFFIARKAAFSTLARPSSPSEPKAHTAFPSPPSLHLRLFSLPSSSMSNHVFPLGSVGQAAFLPDESRTSSTPPVPNFTRELINAVKSPFRSSSKLPPFDILIATKDGVCRGIDSDEAENDPEMVGRLLTGFCEMKRKKGNGKEVIGRKLGEVEVVSFERFYLALLGPFVLAKADLYLYPCLVIFHPGHHLSPLLFPRVSSCVELDDRFRARPCRTFYSCLAVSETTEFHC